MLLFAGANVRGDHAHQRLHAAVSRQPRRRRRRRRRAARGGRRCQGDARSTGSTPLMLAAASGNADAVRLLLDAGADINAREAAPRADGVDVCGRLQSRRRDQAARPARRGRERDHARWLICSISRAKRRHGPAGDCRRRRRGRQRQHRRPARRRCRARSRLQLHRVDRLHGRDDAAPFRRTRRARRTPPRRCSTPAPTSTSRAKAI